jgi:DNA-binding MarR family transcriptional regulator
MSNVPAPICPVIGARPDVLLVKLAMAVKGIADETYAPFGLRCAHTTVLQLLTQEGPRSQRVLGEELHIDRSTMVVLMDDLERDGLVERHPDSADRRAYAVSITDRGRARSAETEAAMLDAQERVFGPLAPAERAELTRLLLRLAQAGHLPGFGGAEAEAAPPRRSR